MNNGIGYHMDKKTDEEKFMALTRKKGNHWLWIGCKNKSGIPTFTLVQTVNAYWASMVLFKGLDEFAEKKPRVVSNCGAKLCVRPEHLRITEGKQCQQAG